MYQYLCCFLLSVSVFTVLEKQSSTKPEIYCNWKLSGLLRRVKILCFFFTISMNHNKVFITFPITLTINLGFSQRFCAKVIFCIILDWNSRITNGNCGSKLPLCSNTTLKLSYNEPMQISSFIKIYAFSETYIRRSISWRTTKLFLL